MSDVPFVRRDAQGNITSWGHMHLDHINAEKEDGVDIRQEEIGAAPVFKGNLHTILMYNISRVLGMTDHYFAGDALENVTESDQGLWREYRKALRAAAKETDPPKMLAVIPTKDPKGVDHFAKFR